MLDWQITSHHPSDTLGTSIRYCSADLYNTDTMYHPLDVHWHVLNDTMSQYYLHYYQILGLNGMQMKCLRIRPFDEFIHQFELFIVANINQAPYFWCSDHYITSVTAYMGYAKSTPPVLP